MPPIPFAARTNWKLATNDLTRAIESARARGQQIFDLTESNPTRVGLAVSGEVLAALASAAVMHYEPHAAGMLSAREAVARYYRDRESTAQVSSQVSADEIILTTSTSEGYAHAFRLLANAGDEVLVPAPSYPLLQFLADLQDVKLVNYELIYDHGWQIDFGSLRAAITPRSRAIVLVHPNNPTGSYVSAREREELNRIAQEFGLALIVDEVFLDYALEPDSRESIHSFASNRDALTFTLSGLSKVCCLPQMKLGWMVVTGPDAMVAEAIARLEVIADTYLSVGTPVQIAAPAMLGHRHAIQQELRERIVANLAVLDAMLSAIPSCERLQVQGGWYAVIRVPATRSDETLAIELLEQTGVLVHPGHFFDFPREGYLVVSLIAQVEEFNMAIRRISVVLAVLG